jgi:Domain of unknown function (DUF4304)
MIFSILKGEGFRRKGVFWSKIVNDEVTHMVELTRSRFAPRTYIGIGVWGQSIHGEPAPHDPLLWDLFGRTEHVTLTVEENRHTLSDDYPFSNEERLERLNAIWAETHEKFYDNLHDAASIERMALNSPKGVHVGFPFRKILYAKGLRDSPN